MFRERCARLQQELDAARSMLIEKAQQSGVGMMRAVAGRLRHRDACDAISQWRYTHLVWKRKKRADLIFRRAIGHARYTEMSHGFQNWRTHFIVDTIDACSKLQREVKRAELRSEKELIQITAKLEATAHVAHRGVVRNVVQHLRHRHLSPAVIIWYDNTKRDHLQQQAQQKPQAPQAHTNLAGSRVCVSAVKIPKWFLGY